MAAQRKSKDAEADQALDRLLRRALATPPISNEEIERRSKEAKRKR